MRRPKRSAAKPADALREVKDQISGAAAEVRDGARAAAGELTTQVGDVVRAIADSAREQAGAVFDRQREAAAARVAKMGDMAGQAAHALRAVRMDGAAGHVEAAGERVRRASGYVLDRSLDDVLEAAGEVVNRHRTPVLAGLFVAAFAAARFLRASTPPDPEALARAEDGASRDARPPARRRPSRAGGRRRGVNRNQP